ncbi:MAG: type VI secretion system protein TssA [Acidobacteriia bacterium]|nr:type VI secretion system protein TssA [Terriglobia bacterium]
MPLRDDLLTPIPGDNPSGVNLRYDPVYDKIKEARREDDDAPQGEWEFERKTADWKQVIKLAGEALASKSKDLQLAAWLNEAMLRTEGFAGLLAGLKLCQGLIENFWDGLYPELEDGDAEFRAAPLDWIGSRFDQPVRTVPVTRKGYDWFQFKQSRAVGYEADAAANETKQEARTQAIADGKITAEDFDAAFSATPKTFYVECKQNLDDCLAAIQSLAEACDSKFGDATPGFGGLRTSLEEVRSTVNGLLQKKRELEPDEEPAAHADEAAGQSGDAEAAGPAPARRKTVTEEPADKDDAFARVAMVAKYLRREDPYSPAPYLMLRGLRWGELRAGGDSPSLELLAPPATQVRQDLKRLSVEGNWAELIEAAENAMAMACGRAWLDLQRYAVRALDEYGYPGIASGIRSELRSLLADVPQLPQWTLADDTPTANAETQAWLKEVTAPPQAVNGFQAMPSMDEAKAAGAGPGEGAPPDAFQIAMESARSGDVQQAIEILSREIAHERSGRARFQRKIQLAQICMTTGHEAIAYPILNEMSDEIEHRKLEEWEASEVLAHPLALLFRCMNQLDGDAEAKRKLYARICRLDPVQALACAK